MPTYDYYSEVTGEEKEVFHGMMENPEVLDSEGNIMKKKVGGGSGYVMKKDGTRNTSWANRYGGKKKKSDHTMTMAESAETKAKMDFQDRKDYEASKHDPYHKFRDNSNF